MGISTASELEMASRTRISSAAVAALATQNWLEFMEGKAELMTNTELAGVIGTDHRNVHRALRLRMDSELLQDRRDELKRVRYERSLGAIPESDRTEISQRAFAKSIGSFSERKRRKVRTSAQREMARSFEVDGVVYRSKREAACAYALQEHVFGYEPVLGETFQVPVGRHSVHGNPIQIDFLVRDLLVEFHPIVLSGIMNDGIGEFATAEEQSAFFEEIAALANGERKAAIQQKKLELRARYAAPREQLIASNPRYAGTPLVVIEDHRELYRQVLTRFSSLLPTESRFVTEFNRYVERL